MRLRDPDALGGGAGEQTQAVVRIAHAEPRVQTGRAAAIHELFRGPAAIMSEEISSGEYTTGRRFRLAQRAS